MNVYHCDVAIAGAWFAGISAYLMLKKRNPHITVKLFDMSDKFTFFPWLHEAVGDTNRLRSLQFDLKKVYGEDFVHAKVTRISKNHFFDLHTGDQWHFDYAIIATGSRVNFYWNKDFERYAYTVRWWDDIPKLNAALKTAQHVSIIGWGFTWVEVASVLAERKLPLSIRLIHSKDRLFDRYHPNVGRISYSYLHKQWVEVILDDKVTGMSDSDITLASGKTLPSDVSIMASGIKVNDEEYAPELTFNNDYTSIESDHIMMCGDIAVHGLYTTAHNAFIEWRRVGTLIADKLQWITKTYPPLQNFDQLAIALWRYDGIMVLGKQYLYLPLIVGFLKRMIEKKILFEFTHKIMLPF